MKKRTIYLSISVILLLGSYLFFPVKVPYELKSYGKIMPANKWVLSKGTDGQLIASSTNYVTGVSAGYSVAQFERGAEMKLSLRRSLITERYVDIGDTIGTVYASDIEERLAELNGKLGVAQAALEANLTGEKPAVVQEAEQRLIYTKAKAAEQHKIVARLQRLYEKNLIAEEEIELATNKALLLDIEISIDKARLEAVQTGAKPAKIKLLEAEINAFRQQRDALERRKQSFNITASTKGKISRTFSSDTLLVISDTTTFVAFMPIKLKDLKYLSETHSVSIRTEGRVQTFSGELVSLDKEVHVIQGEQVIVVSAVLKKVSGDILPGILAECIITCKPVTTVEYVKRVFKNMMA